MSPKNPRCGRFPPSPRPINPWAPAGERARQAAVSGVVSGCLIRKACGAACSGEVIPARPHLEAWVNIWVRSAGSALVLAGWLLLGEKRERRAFSAAVLLISGSDCSVPVQAAALCWCLQILFLSVPPLINMSGIVAATFRVKILSD